MNDNHPSPARQMRDRYVMPDHPALAEFRRMFGQGVKVQTKHKQRVNEKLAQIFNPTTNHTTGV